MIKSCHLRIHCTQNTVIAIRIYCINSGNSILKALDGTRCLAHVAVGAAEEVVGAEALVRGAVAVEVVGGLAEEAVGGNGDVVAVEAVGTVEDGRHGGTAAGAVAGGQQQGAEDGKQGVVQWLTH